MVILPQTQTKNWSTFPWFGGTTQRMHSLANKSSKRAHKCYMPKGILEITHGIIPSNDIARNLDLLYSSNFTFPALILIQIPNSRRLSGSVNRTFRTVDSYLWTQGTHLSRLFYYLSIVCCEVQKSDRLYIANVQLIFTKLITSYPSLVNCKNYAQNCT